MIYRVIAMLNLVAFYGLYVRKIWIQKKQNIRTNQAGVGDKPKKVLMVERIMGIATVLAVVAEVISVLAAAQVPGWGVQALGAGIGVLAVVIFGLATKTMRDSWRVGIPEEKTELVTDGIYRYSRNPAFVGFDLMYLSVCLTFFNVPLVLASAWAAGMLHLQILQEETHLQQEFGEAYGEYRKQTMRYFGRKERRSGI